MLRSALSRRYLFVAFTVLAVNGAVASPAAHAVDPGYEPNQTDGTAPSAQDFGWSASLRSPVWVQVPATDFCSPVLEDAPDGPLRAFSFKNSNPPGDNHRVQFNWPKGRADAPNRRLIGPTLHGAQREHKLPAPEHRPCEQNSVFNGQHQPYAWQHFDDNEWLTQPYYVPDPTQITVANSGTVHALMHQEFRAGDAGPNNADCKDTGVPITLEAPKNCWFGSITSAYSDRQLLYTVPGQPTQFNPSYHCYTLGNYGWVPPAPTPNEIGACYSHVSPPGPSPYQPNLSPPPSDLSKHIVGTLPYQYYSGWGRHGYKESSNVIRVDDGGPRDGYFVLTNVSAPAYTGPPEDSTRVPTTQKEGVCLLWTSDLSDPSSWKAWNGHDFALHPRSFDSTRTSQAVADLACEPVITTPLAQPWSLTYNTYLEKYMLVLSHPGGLLPHDGIHYRLSDDLINWSDEQLLAEIPNGGQGPASRCKDGFTYPTVLDPNDPASHWPDPPANPTNPNFDHPGATPDIYANFRDVVPPRAGVENKCAESETQTAARLGVDFTKQRQANLDFGLTDPRYGYDQSWNLVEGCPGGSYGSLPGQGGCSTAWRYAGGVGSIDTKWKVGDDVWYGSAYYLPSSLASIYPDVRIMRWGGVGIYGAIRTVGTAGTSYKLVYGTSPPAAETDVGLPFDIPTGRWVWVEAHQRLSPLNDGSAYSEVFVDGRLVSQSALPNMAGSGATITSLQFGFTDGALWTPQFHYMGIDRSTILGAQKGTPTAPPTPLGLREVTPRPSGQIKLDWEVVSGAAGYRIWERSTAAAVLPWVSTDASSPPYTDSTFTCNQREYRITSYKTVSGHVEESNVSATLRPKC